MKRFSSATSRVPDAVAASRPDSASRREFLRKGAGAEVTARAAPVVAPSERERRLPVKPAVPTRHELVSTYVPSVPTQAQKDFIRTNAIAAISMPAGSAAAPAGPPPAADKLPQRKVAPGQVPKYLKTRKAELAAVQAQEAAERAAKAAMSNCPPGHRLIPESERQEILAELRGLHAEALKVLRSFPMIVDTESMKASRATAERRVDELEGAIKTFERPKVFIRDG
jgi:hypothetical protein